MSKLEHHQSRPSVRLSVSLSVSLSVGCVMSGCVNGGNVISSTSSHEDLRHDSRKLAKCQADRHDSCPGGVAELEAV